jgi:hypothetical protein
MERRKLPKPRCKRFTLIVFSALWAPLCAVSLALSSKYTAEQPLTFGREEAWLFFAASFVYNIHNNYAQLRIAAQLAGLIAAILLVTLPPDIRQIALVAGCMWIGYYALFRSWAVLKPILISTVWVLATHSIPIHNWYWDNIALFRFGLVFVLSLGYDLVDQQNDTIQNTQTLVLRLGNKKTGLLATTIMVLFALIAYDQPIIRLPIFVSSTCSIALILFITNKVTTFPQTIFWKWAIDAILIIYSISSLLTTQ